MNIQALQSPLIGNYPGTNGGGALMNGASYSSQRSNGNHHMTSQVSNGQNNFMSNGMMSGSSPSIGLGHLNNSSPASMIHSSPYMSSSSASSNTVPSELTDPVDRLKYFLATAPTNWKGGDIVKRFMLGNGEHISCVYWKNLFYVTGTDIVKILLFRFQAINRPIMNTKKFEEGVFSDLRNLKPGVDATLEEPRSEFLEVLYRNGCIRTQKKQKVFYWFSVPHDRLFMDALERDLKRESNMISVNSFLKGGPNGGGHMGMGGNVFMGTPPSASSLLMMNGLGSPMLGNMNDGRSLNSPGSFMFAHSGNGFGGPFASPLPSPSILSNSNTFNTSLSNMGPSSPSLQSLQMNNGLLSPTSSTNSAYSSSVSNTPSYLSMNSYTAKDGYSNEGEQMEILDGKDAYPTHTLSSSSLNNFDDLSSNGHSYMNNNNNGNTGPQREFSCSFPSCHRIFPRYEYLKRHFRVHSGDRPYACPVETCGKSYSRSDNLAQHLKIHSPDVVPPAALEYAHQQLKQLAESGGELIPEDGLDPISRSSSPYSSSHSSPSLRPSHSATPNPSYSMNTNGGGIMLPMMNLNKMEPPSISSRVNPWMMDDLGSLSSNNPSFINGMNPSDFYVSPHSSLYSSMNEDESNNSNKNINNNNNNIIINPNNESQADRRPNHQGISNLMNNNQSNGSGSADFSWAIQDPVENHSNSTSPPLSSDE